MFKNFNANPKGKKVADCSIRAISTAIGKSWQDVYRDMFEHSIKECTVFNDKKFIKKYITNVLGLEMQKQPRFTSGKKLTVSDFATWYNSGTYIITIANHLTVVKDGVILDTWNCENKCVGNFWRV